MRISWMNNSFALMRAIVIFLLLAAVLCKVHKVEFTLDAERLNYHIQGYGYPNINHLSWLGAGSGLSAPYNGTFTDSSNAKYPVSGTISIGEPLLFHLSKIEVKGNVDNPDKLSFEGKLKVHVFDLAKRKVPLKGKLKFSNNQESDVVLHVDKSGF
eukprot:TRINITY_DN1065_c0_g2_i2.p1 TRINITY_DN1065_c0_g2~~TRINITY_DN1065_c0_g2_i2.p1  ORF type:complete len:156 (+),score=18.95 TRINITY_DN1065_c0_g2_i2:78-545(+)